MDRSQQEQIKEAVRSHYAERATADSPLCSAPKSCCGPAENVAQMMGYSQQELCSLPEEAKGSTLGCGNPLAFSEIQQGDVVLDLGSGAGMDVILAAHEVGERGKVIGLDMTPEMIDRGMENAEKAGVQKVVEFRLGEMEDMPVDGESVDLIISNCVVNLSADKEGVFREAYRVLKPDGRMLISDLVSSGLLEETKRDLSAWAQCLGGTIEEAQYLRLIRDAGFADVAVVDKVDVTDAMLGAECCGTPANSASRPRIHSIRVRAVKAARQRAD